MELDNVDGARTIIPPRTFKFKPKPLKIKPHPTAETKSEPAPVERHYYRELRVKRTDCDQKCVIADGDFISKLQDELLHKILSSLSLRELVRTSVLSRRWRHVSAYQPTLHFNWKEMFITEAANYDFCKANKVPCIIPPAKDIVGAINEYLKFYRGENIHLFEVNLCFCCSGLKYIFDDGWNFDDADDDIDGWITFALKRGVKSLTLFTLCVFDSCDRCSFYRENCTFYYLFRTELFYGIAVKNLKHLKLRSCALGPNFTNQLSSLESISLDNVDHLSSNLESMFPFWGKLKTLEIANSALPKRLSLSSLPKLQKFMAYKPSLVEEIELLNPDLIEFKCLSDYGVKCNLSGAPKLTSLSFTVPLWEMNLIEFKCLSDFGVKCNLSGAPKLTSLSYTVPLWEMNFISTEIPLQNPELLRNLTLVLLNDWVNWAPPTRINQVTKLNLQFLKPSDFSLVRIITILKTFPLLHGFQLTMNCPKDLQGEGEIEHHDLSYVPEYLKEVTISYLQYTRLQMQFVKYLLQFSTALEKMSILVLLPFIRETAPARQEEYSFLNRMAVLRQLEYYERFNILDLKTVSVIPNNGGIVSRDE